ncbi:hypothetical protein EW146_g6482, partial [Bondarzewia mesenterica]
MANYLPLLLVSVTNAIPDDSSVSTQPRGQVDYLSHEWREEDVWRSWRNMTRQKNEIANGARLENASWRTWWKQRNKLKTISPETLNWLKDSDVTWLYGPLHTDVDWSPPPTNVDKEKSVQDRLGLSTDDRSYNIPGKKPILKHRSISDLLTSALPTSAQFDDADEDLDTIDEDDEDLDPQPTRPPLLHTKSDTHISQRSGSSDSARETTGGSSQDLNVQANGGKKKHISFNTFVEQCIAIDSPQKSVMTGRRHLSSTRLYEDVYDDGYDQDSEAECIDDALDEPSLFSEGHAGSDSDEDDDILEMRTSSTRSRSSSSSRSPGMSYAQLLHPNIRPPLIHTGSSDKEHMTIAPIAPTMLKTTGVGNHAGMGHSIHQSQHVNLVYVPSLGSAYASVRRSSTGSSSEDVYRHREARFSVGAGLSRGASPHPALYGHAPHPQLGGMLSPPTAESPEEEAFDYFGNVALEQALQEDEREGVVRYAQGGAESVTNGRNSGPVVYGRQTPEVVVNDEDGMVEERRERSRSRSRSKSRSRSRSHSRTPSPAEVTRIVDTLPSTDAPDLARASSWT